MMSLNFSGPHSPRSGLSSACNYFNMFSFRAYFVLFILSETRGRKFAQKPVPYRDHLSYSDNEDPVCRAKKSQKNVPAKETTCECLCIICELCAEADVTHYSTSYCCSCHL